MNTISPLDDRYAPKLRALAASAGADALTQNRVRAEIAYLTALAEAGLTKLSPAERGLIKKLGKLSAGDIAAIKKTEAQTNHDVKAVEYFLAAKLPKQANWLHFAITSEDINSLAYALIIRDSLEDILIPLLTEVQKTLLAISKKYAGALMLARTHGQPAVPTTFGKEVRIFEHRLCRQIEQLKKLQISCKFSGAAGNFNAHYAALPDVDWQKFSAKFINSFNKSRTTKIFAAALSAQADPHDTYAEAFDNLRRANTILLDLCQDFWRYISDGLIAQKVKEGETGSSTMPQKVNPIDFENAEGNFGLANALYAHFSAKLPVSRLQRDLSDSTVLRNIAPAFGYNIVALKSLLKGLSKTLPDINAMAQMLNKHPEVIAEGIQTILRAAGQPKAYENLKTLTRGKKITMQILQNFIDNLNVAPAVKTKLKTLTPQNYTGIAAKLAKGKK